jgi:hypothetical protein
MAERNTVEWRLAYRQLLSFEENLPALIDEQCVQHYHGILDELQSVSELEINHFRIELTELAYQTVRRAASTPGPQQRDQSAVAPSDRSPLSRSRIFGLEDGKVEGFLAP